MALGYAMRIVAALVPVFAWLAAAEDTCEFPGGGCYELRLMRCKAGSNVTLHGLWPEWATNCHGPAFDLEALAPIRAQMEVEWPSCYGLKDENFWQHEWSKHGTCTGMEQLAFFQKALELRRANMDRCNNESQCSFCFSKDFQERETCSNGQLAEIRTGGANSTNAVVLV